jgi:hypothetical protein
LFKNLREKDKIKITILLEDKKVRARRIRKID